MKLFEFTPEVAHLIGAILQAIGVIVIVITAFYGYAELKEAKNEKAAAVLEKEEAEKLLESVLDDLYKSTQDYAKIYDNNSYLLKKVNELKVKIARSDQPRVGGKFSVKKAVKANQNIGKYECIFNLVPNFEKGKLYERYIDESQKHAFIIIGDDRQRHEFQNIFIPFRLVES